IIDAIDEMIAKVRCPSSAPVVDYVIAKIHNVARRLVGAAQGGMPIAASRKKIMVQGEITPGTAIGGAHGVLAFIMQAVVQRLAQDAPLQGEVAAMAKIVRAVNRPTQRAM